jgi:transcription initiation factor IIE alpha subunit
VEAPRFFPTAQNREATRAEIINASGVKPTQVTNALKALRERHIILSNDKRQGEYRLPTRSFAVWIKALNAKRERHK